MNPIAVVSAPGSPGEQPSVRPQPGFADYARKAARALSSLQLTVVLLGLALTGYRDMVVGAFIAAFVCTVLVSQAAILIRD